MKKIKLGFFKAPQGVFTKEIIANIEKKLAKIDNVELYTGLDFRKGHIVNDRVIVGSRDLSDLDVYFWHDTIRASEWEGDNYYLNILKVLEKNCIVINSSESSRIVSDKFLSHSILRENGLPVVDFALLDMDAEKIRKVFKEFSSSIVIKPRFGGWGIGVEKISSEKELSQWINRTNLQNNRPKQVFIEKYLENDLSQWIAVVVMGNKVLFGYRKKIMSGSDWKIYDPQKKDGKGEFSEYVMPADALKDIALKAKKVIGKDIIGFDFICTKDGYKIVDENGRPGLYKKCLEDSKINIEDEIAELIIQKIKTLEK